MGSGYTRVPFGLVVRPEVPIERFRTLELTAARSSSSKLARKERAHLGEVGVMPGSGLMVGLHNSARDSLRRFGGDGGLQVGCGKGADWLVGTLNASLQKHPDLRETSGESTQDTPC
eukprot:471284-Prorocentrum_minimum.AAC.1